MEDVVTKCDICQRQKQQARSYDLRRVSTAAVQVTIDQTRNEQPKLVLRSPSNFSQYGFDKLDAEDIDEY